MMNNKLKILIITQNEPFFIPKMIKHLVLNSRDFYEIIGISILAPHRKNKNYLDWFKERANVYNIFELSIAGFLFLYTKFINLTNPKSVYSLKGVNNKFNLKEIFVEDINSKEYIEKIQKLNLDVIISISCPQLFKQGIIDQARYCINAHGTLLPRHRGVFGSWWTLFLGDDIGGSTIHTMELKLDAGEIVWQKEFPIKKSDTQYSIAYKTKRDMSYGLHLVLEKIYQGELVKIEPKYETSYHRAPTKELGKEFHKKGYRVISLRDINKILSRSF